MTVCGGSNCSRKNKCKKYIGNFRLSGDQWEDKKYIDWSTWESVTAGTDENGIPIFKGKYNCGDFSKTHPLYEYTNTYKPKDLQEVKDFIFEALKEKYGDAVISKKDEKHVVIDTQTKQWGNSDVWISLEYFH